MLAKVATIAAPDTILRWYREQVAKKYDGSKRRGPGRPRKAGEIVELVLRMVRENESLSESKGVFPDREPVSPCATAL